MDDKFAHSLNMADERKFQGQAEWPLWNPFTAPAQRVQQHIRFLDSLRENLRTAYLRQLGSEEALDQAEVRYISCVNLMRVEDRILRAIRHEGEIAEDLEAWQEGPDDAEAAEWNPFAASRSNLLVYILRLLPFAIARNLTSQLESMQAWRDEDGMQDAIAELQHRELCINSWLISHTNLCHSMYGTAHINDMR